MDGAPTTRLAPLDLLRGLVMVLMAIDHASEGWNAGRWSADHAPPPAQLPETAQFLTRWSAHLCAPAFLLLAGAALALSCAARTSRGESDAAIDAHLFRRGSLIALLDPLWIALTTTTLALRGIAGLQVLFAIGASMIAMIALRRLPAPALAALALACIGGSEWLHARDLADGALSLPGLLLYGAGRQGHVYVLYPLLPWLGVLLVGWLLGLHLVAARARDDSGRAIARRLALAGAACLALFVAVRFGGGYGNHGLPVRAPTLVGWLLVSKYPPAIAFTALELAICFLVLAALFGRDRAPRDDGPLMVLGQTPLVFYLLHYPLLIWAARLTGQHRQAGLLATLLAAGAAIALLYPLCRRYRALKRARRGGWTSLL